MLESTSGTCAFEVPRTGNRHQPFFGGCPRGVRNWKQACPFFSELPRVEFRVEFGTGNRHVPFFRSCPAWSSAWSSPQSWGDNRIEGGNPGVTTGLKEAILEFFPGNPLARAPMPGRFAETVGLDDSFEKKILGRIPTLARARHPMPGRWRGRVAHPECQEHVHPTCNPTC